MEAMSSNVAQDPADHHDRVDFMGLPLDPLTMEESVERCMQLARDELPRQHVVLNASKVNLASDDPGLARHRLAQPDLVNADRPNPSCGLPPSWAALSPGGSREST